jgi:hypothetical protein
LPRARGACGRVYVIADVDVRAVVAFGLAEDFALHALIFNEICGTRSSAATAAVRADADANTDGDPHDTADGDHGDDNDYLQGRTSSRR